MAAKRFAALSAFFLSIFSISIPAIAQQNEVSLTFGGTFHTGATGIPTCEALPNCPAKGTIDISPAFSLDGNFAHRLADFKAASLWLEMPVLANPSQSRQAVIVSPTFSSLFFTPSLRAHFLPAASVSPFISAGAGLGHFSGQGSDTQWAFQLGGGVDFKTRLPHLGIRAEVRDFINGRPSIGALSNITAGHLQQVYVGAGVVFKF